MRLDAGAAVRVRVPATAANLGPGFDSFGLALSLYDEVEVRVAPGGLTVEVTGEGADTVARDESHLVVRALRAGLDALGITAPGLGLTCTNRIPHGRGLGSSAAAIVAGVVAARALAGLGPDDAWTLRLADEIEGHPDNVAAALLGGFTIAWRDDAAGVAAVRLEPAAGVRAVAYVPQRPLATSVARALLPAAVSHADAAWGAGRAGLLVEALTRRPELLLPATEDRLHQGYRAPAMAESAALVSRLRRDGVPAVISGAGPAVLALVRDGVITPRNAEGFCVLDLTISTGASETRLGPPGGLGN